MTQFDLHTAETVPEASKATFNEIAEGWGMVPNVVAVMAESPALLNGYWRLEGAVDEQTRLDRTEREIVQMAANVENNCTYCMAAHTVAAQMDGVPDDVISAMRENRRLGNARLDALRDLARDMVASRGWPGQENVDAFFAAGYDKGQMLQLVAEIAIKTITNYTNHLAHTPLDEAFAPGLWMGPED